MPDVARSDSQRSSDTSLKPRVSFNRDVHVKRIVPRENIHIAAPVNGDGVDYNNVTSPVRKERLKKSKKQLAEEAAKVIHQADQIDCVTNDRGYIPDKFYTLPSRNKLKSNHPTSSLERKSKRRNSAEAITDIPPKKPPRTFISTKFNESPQKSIFDIFKRANKKSEAKKSNLRRAVSDASNLKSNYRRDDKYSRNKPYGSDSEDNLNEPRNHKKQLSPIVEITQRESYFSPEIGDNNKENDGNNENVYQINTEKDVEVVLIDLDKAEKISNKKSSKFKKNTIGRIKSFTSKKTKSNDNKIKKSTTPNDLPKKKEELVWKKINDHEDLASPAPKIKTAIETLERKPKQSPTMIHSSQKPAEKLPLTRGRTVDTIVKRLSNDSSSPPPKTNLLISPNASVQHNNNQPFSYTRGLSPEKCVSNENLQNPVIYAQVVCANGTSGPSKQTIHTTFNNHTKKQPHSDSDEGLGYEENSISRKYENEKKITHFGDERYFDNTKKSYNKDYLNDVEEEIPITPKFTNSVQMNGYFNYEKKFNEIIKTDVQNGVYDSSYRGRGDGMDSKRRESLSEPLEDDFDQNDSTINNFKNRSDLSARRDLLESRINRRFNDKITTTSKSYPKYETQINKHVIETRFKSDSPKERYNHYDNEQKSDSQLSDYRSSPENKQFEASRNKSNTRYTNKIETQKLYKNRDLYKSTPEINNRNYDNQAYYNNKEDSYHDSLRREKSENRIKTFFKYKNDRYLMEHERSKDKFGDSGIENDIRRDSSEHQRLSSQPKSKRDYLNDSEDEGFASSLLIASERQHAEEVVSSKKNGDYDSDRPYSREDDPYHHLENAPPSTYKTSKFEYAPRERSIDDGSHFDPRIDKEFDSKANRGTLKKIEQKPPKPEKKRGLEKVKQLFSRDTKKKKDKQEMVREESLRARYKEYKGYNDHLEPTIKKREAPELNRDYDYSNRRRLATPSPSPTRQTQSNKKTEVSHSWFKSLDRLSRKKTKKDAKDGNLTSTEEETIPPKSAPTKNLRFFGDTDIESNDSLRQKPSYKIRSGIASRDRIRSQSTRDLHNISEEFLSPELSNRKSGHKSMTNIFESDKETRGSKSNLKPPMSPNQKGSNRDLSRSKERDRDREGKRRKNEVSSVESSTEGDSSQQSQRSVVYLHAATVGDIPGPGRLRNIRKAASREELISNDSSRIQPQVKTLSRSFSVLAPWRPRHYREDLDIDYTQYPKPVKNGKYEQKITKNGSSRKENSSTLKKKAQETRRSNQNVSTLNRRSRSKENVSNSTLRRSRDELSSKDATSTMYKKKDRLPRENLRYNNRDKDDSRKMSSKSMSVESLGGKKSRDVSRSKSMPKDPEKSAGWFRMNKKSKKSGSTQRL